MDLTRLVTKVENLKKINMKVNNDKNILLINMMKLNKNLSYYIQSAIKNKNLIDAVGNQYNIKNMFVHKNTKSNFLNKIKQIFIKQKELWIYTTEQQKYATDSYSRYERYILEKTKNKNVDFITIGDRAYNFCKQNKFNVIKDFPTNTQSVLAFELSQIIKILYLEQNYRKVRFVLNTNKNFKGSFTILPTQEFDVYKLSSSTLIETNKLDIKDFKIFPNVETFIDNEANIFIENVVNSLLIESSFYTTKNALVTANKIIKDLDENIMKLSRQAMRVKRQNEIEEIIMLTSNNKNDILSESDDGK
ncbi:MSC_0622 family F1-like ATPase gamma subunit [Metamycoplasma salivarium]|uniref:MSC_0622 family F1-like ATPase gamma subunit n=1 Tax=Metamycoplasma salivarium TaxID=2124 RepID=UPI0035BC8B5A